VGIIPRHHKPCKPILSYPHYVGIILGLLLMA